MEKDAEKNSALREIYDYVELFVTAVLIVAFFFTLVFRLSTVDGSSMEKTLFSGASLLVSGLFYEPQRGDIVVIHDMDIDNGKAIVKRVIGKSGDVVSVNKDGVYVNGKKLSEDGSQGYAVDFTVPYGQPYHYQVASYIVPEGQLFVMGDHRSVSYDSRAFGCVDERSVVGKVLFRLWPFSSIGTV
ncbi:MAG: signal peptidase I [Clostridia bacterium]|nr:signal peptidase I [Clostridia bacterium]